MFFDKVIKEVCDYEHIRYCRTSKKMYKKGCSLINRLIFDKIIVAEKVKGII